MKKRKNNIWLTIGVIVICVLLLYWLFARTLIVEDEELGTTDVPALIEQSPGEESFAGSIRPGNSCRLRPTAKIHTRPDKVKATLSLQKDRHHE